MKKVLSWNHNTDLCVDVKTILRSDRMTRIGKNYPGMLRRDAEDHYSFVETCPPTSGKRNPCIFHGEFFTVTRRDNSSLRLNFKELKMGDCFSVERYALGVYNELCMALEGLVEEG